ncbi:MAG: hypothetical protein ACOCUH_02545, partial [Bacteriovoracia bacterium]
MSTLFKDIIEHEIYPAIGCTEPISCAYAAAIASSQLPGIPKNIHIHVDSGTFKNGNAVTVPYTKGAKGNLIAACLGAFLKKHDKKLQLLELTTDKELEKAYFLYDSDNSSINVIEGETKFCVDVTVSDDENKARCKLYQGHTNVVLISLNDKIIHEINMDFEDNPLSAYRKKIKSMAFNELLNLPTSLDSSDINHIKKGIELNLKLS